MKQVGGRAELIDYQTEMNLETFREWFPNKLLLDLRPKAVTVMDNVRYKAPITQRRKSEIAVRIHLIVPHKHEQSYWNW
jgi:hypothetical protein